MANLDNKEILDYGLRFIDKAEAQGVPVRLLGAVAIRQHCTQYRDLFERADRPITDLDIVTYSRQMKPLKRLIREEGLVGDEQINSIYGERRQIYAVPAIAGLKIDIFFDRLEFCHTVPFQGRLELDYPTITMTDVLLEKMQIVQINAKDLKDTIILLLEHGISQGFEKESIDIQYLKTLLCSDWGFYYTMTQNLGKTIEFMREQTFVDSEEALVVEDRVSRLLRELESAPKSLEWKVRAKVGPSVKWYRDVEEAGGVF